MTNQNKLTSINSNLLDSAALFDKLDQLSIKRESWENGACKQSNSELYSILAECLDLYTQVLGSVGLRRKLSKALRQRSIKINSNTSLETRIVRWVFGDCGNRAFTYAAVIAAAHEANVDPLKLPNWLVASNGIENVRRASSKSTMLPDSQLENLAIDKFANSKKLSTISKKVPALTPNCKANHEYSAALVRQNQSGEFEIVYASNKPSTVKALLVDAGKKLHKESAAANVATSTAAQSKRINAAIAKTVGANS